ncbi:MAG: response regulator transcription factor [candidate division KSB1 bacterium]|nr:response regulator transcription factor [candidate division KSB1 bacterium]MDZ7301696.1 response regulator transcription factor [candidate division KSB1 bacterium]MDZ7312417.1 response regulator transcription factor [candidate division KSB1 bacterium]
MKILLVEDNAKMRALLRKTITRYIAEVEKIYECDDGNEAVALYSRVQPYWVIMDIELKTMDGLTATALIMKAHPAAKIIILTQYNDPLYREAAQRAGAFDYVLKENIFELAKIIHPDSKD